MPNMSRLLAVGALLLLSPLAEAPAQAAAPKPPYHLAADPDHAGLMPAGRAERDRQPRWEGDDREERRWSGDRRRWHGWPQPNFRGHRWWGTRHLLPLSAIERQLRRHHLQPIGRIEWRHGVYLVRAIDPFGRRVLVAVDPVTGKVLGRHRGH